MHAPHGNPSLIWLQPRLAGRDAAAVQLAYKVVKKTPQKHIRGRVSLHLEGPNLTVFKGDMSVLQHVLLDVVYCQSSGPVLAVVCRQVVNDSPANVCHLYLLNNKKRVGALPSCRPPPVPTYLPSPLPQPVMC